MSLEPPLGIFLRTVEPPDLPFFFEIQNDPIANQMAAVKPRSPEDFAKHWDRILNSPKLFAQSIIYQGQLAGCIGCYETEGQIHVGYSIGREFWGRGVATEAMKALLQLVRDRPLHARVASHNIASLRVLAKCGFVEEGRMAGPEDERYLPCEEVLLILRN